MPDFHNLTHNKSKRKALNIDINSPKPTSKRKLFNTTTNQHQTLPTTPPLNLPQIVSPTSNRQKTPITRQSQYHNLDSKSPIQSTQLKFTPLCKTPNVKLTPKTQRICRKNNLTMYYPSEKTKPVQTYFTTTSNCLIL